MSNEQFLFSIILPVILSIRASSIISFGNNEMYVFNILFIYNNAIGILDSNTFRLYLIKYGENKRYIHVAHNKMFHNSI